MQRLCCLAAGLLLFCQPLHASDADPVGYQARLDSLLADVLEPLAQAQALQASKPLGLAVAGFHEWQSGQRSAFCARVESDINTKTAAWTQARLPEPEKQAQVWAALGGAQADLNDAATLAQFGQRLGVDLVLTGRYLLQNRQLLLQVELLQCRDRALLWSGSLEIPAADVRAYEVDLIPGSRPLAYLAPPLPAAQKPALTDALTEPPDPWARFSWARLNLGAGIKAFYPQNPAFRRATHDLRGGYVKLGVADVFNFEYDFWSQDGSPLADVDGLSAYSWSLSASAPWHLGRYVVLYAGLGGRFESIAVESRRLPSNAEVSFGNNSLLALAGLKLHRGPWGLDSALSWDLGANYTPYLRAQVGLNYELSLD